MNPDHFARAKELLIEIVDLTEEERRAYLDKACKGNPSLRKEVESVLAFEGETLLTPLKTRLASSPSVPLSKTPLPIPHDLLLQARKRLGILALVYALVFFFSTYFSFFLAGVTDWFFSSFVTWGPATLSIVVSLIVFGVARSQRFSMKTVMNIGLAYEVFGSYGIAMAEYAQQRSGRELTLEDFWGLSWVGVWLITFTIVVPNVPRKALLAAIASASAVPVTLELGLISGDMSIVPAPPTPVEFVLGTCLPYILCVFMAYIGARTIYKLGTALTEAREVGSYRLIEQIGQGGMGEVWRAKHRLLTRPAAIKFLRADVFGMAGSESQESVLERFEREAEATASMVSPHTIELYDFGVSDDGRFYYVMELLDGFDIDTLVRRFGPVPPERAIYFLRQVCHSLAEAHEKGLIHRDIKPANVFACRFWRELDFVKVLDFGLVGSGKSANGTVTAVPAESIVAGTPAYMAPEQVLHNRPVDARTDIYAVGCVGYWLLTGKQVFEARSVTEMMAHHAKMAPTPPSQRTDQEIPDEMERIILSCLEKDPDRRPQSADALSDMLASGTIAAQWTPERARQWWDGHHPQTARGEIS